jgi:integrase
MAIEKRGKIYWYSFVWRGERVRESTKQGNKEVARDLMAAHRVRLARGEAGIADRAPVPTFAEFVAQRFEPWLRSEHAAKPNTLAYYMDNLKALALYKPLQDAKLDAIDTDMVDDFVAKRRVTKRKGGKSFLKVATINRSLEVWRHALNKALEWGVLQKAPPKISGRPGQGSRERILTHAEAQAYLAAAKQPLRDTQTLILDGGFRPEEVHALRWERVHLSPTGRALYGYIHIDHGKSKYAKRNVSLTARSKALLEMRHSAQGQPSEGWVFPAETESGHTDTGSLKGQHAKALKDSGLALSKGSRLEAIVPYSFRHTMLTRLGEAGADAFAIQRIAGHSSILMSQRYVHPTPEKLETAFTKLQDYNNSKEKELMEQQERERLTASVQ